ncbi:hypothetical protein AAFF_G00253650 [Aldrovandia affinis]|uniref:Uncharacterized protein n=1 Tax=Aldrovandia affinis TaxID=143900 RepID=A0AAD7SU89_9TELE|nr:hypothetical protein AAFF_G00253650 [Aldrovandia affinis]
MGLKWYPHPEELHCIKGCEGGIPDLSPYPRFPIRPWATSTEPASATQHGSAPHARLLTFAAKTKTCENDVCVSPVFDFTPRPDGPLQTWEGVGRVRGCKVTFQSSAPGLNAARRCWRIIILSDGYLYDRTTM